MSSGDGATGARSDNGSWTPPSPPRVLSTRRVFQGRVIGLRVDEVDLPRGPAVREVVEHPGAVVVAAIDDVGRVALVRQYRHAVGLELLELPAGGLEHGEDPLESARRELREEVGLEAAEWVSLGSFFASPGFLREELHAYVALGLRTVPVDPDDDEDLALVWCHLEAAIRGDVGLRDAKSLATLLLVERYRSGAGAAPSPAGSRVEGAESDWRA